MPLTTPTRTSGKPTRTRRGLAATAASCLAVAMVMMAGPAVAADGPFNINGVVPDTNASITEIDDQFGNVKELGPLNSNTTKIGVIHDDAVPTLGDTNPNAQVDLRRGVRVESRRAVARRLGLLDGRLLLDCRTVLPDDVPALAVRLAAL